MSNKRFIEKKPFDLIGQFDGFVALESYKLKYLRLKNVEQEYLIYIPKEQRLTLYKTLVRGEQISCQGESTYNQVNGESKWKAYSIEKVIENKLQKVLICQGSGCLKKGSEKFSQELQLQLERENLDKQVKITSTGCLKNCKQGVNLILMPSQQKYCQVQAKQIPTIIRDLRANTADSLKHYT